MAVLIQDCTLLAPDAARGVHTHQSLRIDGNIVAGISDKPFPVDAADSVIDGRHLLAIPGLINAHTHSPENALRGTTDRLPLEPWLVSMFGTTGDYAPRDAYVNVMLGAIEMLQSGATAVVDHLWAPGALTPEYLDAAMQAYADSGMRAAVAPLFSDYHFENDYGAALGFPLGDTFYGRRAVPAPEDILSLLENWFERWHGHDNGRLRCFVGPGGGTWCSAELLQAADVLARRFDSGLHMHLLETRVQELGALHRFGRTNVRWLAALGLLAPHVSLPHAVWVREEDDLAMLAASGACVVHNPAANLKLGSGLAPIRRMLDHGIPVALGCDGAASSDNQVVFEALRLAALIHNATYDDPEKWISARDAVAMATVGGAAVLGLSGRLGLLAPGYLADITLLDLRSAHLTPLNDAYRSLALCETGSSVHTVIIDGRIVVTNRRIVAFDADALLEEARDRFAERTWHSPPTDEVRQAIEIYAAWRRAVLSRL